MSCLNFDIWFKCNLKFPLPSTLNFNTACSDIKQEKILKNVKNKNRKSESVKKSSRPPFSQMLTISTEENIFFFNFASFYFRIRAYRHPYGFRPKNSIHKRKTCPKIASTPQGYFKTNFEFA